MCLARTKHDMFQFLRWQASFVVVHHRDLIVNYETNGSLHFFSRERWCWCHAKVRAALVSAHERRTRNGLRLPTNTTRTSSTTLPSLRHSEPPPQFPLSVPFTCRVHHLSGLHIDALAHTTWTHRQRARHFFPTQRWSLPNFHGHGIISDPAPLHPRRRSGKRSATSRPRSRSKT